MKPSEVPDDRTPGTEPREHFEGHDGRECGEHRTCGHRAWCFDCSEWCYPTIPCRGCELPKLRAALTAREEPTMPEPADRPSLRDQIAQAMRDANGTPEALAAWQRHPQLVPVDVYADAVLPVVEAETAALREQAQAVVDEVLSICDSFETAPDGSPEYIYSLGRKDGLDWVRAAVERAMGKGERNSIPYVPKERAEEAERERDTAREALDAAAIVIASLRDQRDEQRQRAENAERQREQALNAIADERRGRLAAEAAVRRAREIHRRHDCARHVNPRTPVPCVNEGLCDGCAARYPCQTATALEAEQPKETP